MLPNTGRNVELNFPEKWKSQWKNWDAVKHCEFASGYKPNIESFSTFLRQRQLHGFENHDLGTPREEEGGWWRYPVKFNTAAGSTQMPFVDVSACNSICIYLYVYIYI